MFELQQGLIMITVAGNVSSHLLGDISQVLQDIANMHILFRRTAGRAVYVVGSPHDGPGEVNKCDNTGYESSDVHLVTISGVTLREERQWFRQRRSIQAPQEEASVEGRSETCAALLHVSMHDCLRPSQNDMLWSDTYVCRIDGPKLTSVL